jgi:NADH:ubiquinone oxidoreductase subunit 6 (subunit J)
MSAGEILLNVFFYVMALSAVAGAVSVAVSRNIVRSAFALLAVLFSAAAMYAIMKADFIAAAQVLIYVGGILVLIMFAVMLTHRITDVNISNESTPGPAPFFACLCLLFALGVVVLTYGRWERDTKLVVAKAGDRELLLGQYQADGATGLERGGNAFEERVVLLVKPVKESAVSAYVEVAPVVGEGKKDAHADWSRKVERTGPIAGGAARVEVGGLGEGPWQWRAQVRLASGELTPWSRGDQDTDVDFRVYRGVTEPAALALMGPYLYAFEAVSVLLLAALVGAAFLARKEVKE